MNLISKQREIWIPQLQKFPFFCIKILSIDISLFPQTQKWKRLSLYPLATSAWEIPLNSSHLCRTLSPEMSDSSPDSDGSFPVAWGKWKEGRLILWKRFNNRVYLGGGGRWTIWKLYTPRICDRPEKYLMNVHRRSRSRHRPLPLASSSYHVPFRHCVLPWKIENRTAMTAEHCSWKCRAAIMSNF